TDEPVVDDQPVVDDEPVVDAGPKYGGTMRITAWGEPVGWDPAKTMYSQLIYMRPVASQLLTIDWWKGPQGTGENPMDLPWIAPPDSLQVGDLAESWEITDHTTVVYNLREGIMWQDKPGIMEPREFVADDVVHNFERFMASEVHIFATDPKHPVSATALDKYTVEIKMNEPSFYQLHTTIPMYFPMVAPEQIEQYGDATDWRNLTGTGPWMVSDYVVGSAVTYERNDNYWMKDPEGRDLPYLDGLSVMIIPEIQTRLTALRSGQVDIMQGVTWQAAEELEETNPELERRSIVNTVVIKLLLDHKNPPFGPTGDPDALKVRQAANMAIDRQGIIDGYFQGNAQTVTNCMAPGLAVAAAVENLPPEAAQLYEFNPERARELLVEAGYPEGLKVTLATDSTSVNLADMFTLVKSMWDDVGFDTELVVGEAASHWGILLSHNWSGAIHAQWGFSTGPGAWDARDGVVTYFNLADVQDDELNDIYDALDDEWDGQARIDLAADSYVRANELASEIYMPVDNLYNYWQPWVGGYSGEMGNG
ncbi:hypothetical protein LCGC14_2402070, partial [marine sediment metagenome]